MADELRETLRARPGPSIAWLARSLGISRSHLSRKLSGERAIKPHEAKRLSELTGLPAARFLPEREREAVA